jgi:hypothetical protein
VPDSQKWLAEPTSSGLILRSVLSGRVLTAPAVTAGSALVQRYDTGAAGQRWTLRAATSQVAAVLTPADAVVPAGGVTTAPASVTNYGSEPVSLTDVSLRPPDGWTAEQTGTTPERLEAGMSATLKWTVTAPEDVTTGFTQLRAAVSGSGFAAGATGAVMTTAASLKGATAFDADFVSGTVTPIDPATNTTGGTIEVGKLPGTIIADPSGSTLYVANQGSASVTVIDTATRKASVRRPQTPDGSRIAGARPAFWLNHS